MAVNLYILPTPSLPTLKTASAESPPHRASVNAFEGTHRPTPPPATVPQQYATVGGVSMIPPSHKPTQSISPPPVYSQPQPGYHSTHPVYSSQPVPETNDPVPNYPTSPYPPNYSQASPAGTASPQYSYPTPPYVASYPNALGSAPMRASPYQ